MDSSHFLEEIFELKMFGLSIIESFVWLGAYLHRRHPEADIAVLAIFRKLGWVIVTKVTRERQRHEDTAVSCDQGHSTRNAPPTSAWSRRARPKRERQPNRQATEFPMFDKTRAYSSIFPKPLLLRREGFNDYPV